MIAPICFLNQNFAFWTLLQIWILNFLTFLFFQRAFKMVNDRASTDTPKKLALGTQKLFFINPKHNFITALRAVFGLLIMGEKFESKIIVFLFELFVKFVNEFENDALREFLLAFGFRTFDVNVSITYLLFDKGKHTLLTRCVPTFIFNEITRRAQTNVANLCFSLFFFNLIFLFWSELF